MINKKSLQNLKPYPKGVSGNPDGRPPVLPELTELIAKLMSEYDGDKVAAEKILRAMYKKALKGDVKAAEFLFKYAYGEAKQFISLTGNMTVEEKQTAKLTFEQAYKLKYGHEPK